jgi:hypothetical protein
MRLTGKQILLCVAIGTAPAVLSGTPFGVHSLGSFAPYLLGKAIGGSLLSMLIAMILPLTARRHALQNGATPRA